MKYCSTDFDRPMNGFPEMKLKQCPQFVHNLLYKVAKHNITPPVKNIPPKVLIRNFGLLIYDYD